MFAVSVFGHDGLRIDRIGDTIQAYASEEGTSWGKANTVTVEGLPAEVHVGIAASGQPSLGLWSVAPLCDMTLEDLRPQFLRGDCNGDQELDIADPVYVFNFLFGNGDLPSGAVPHLRR